MITSHFNDCDSLLSHCFYPQQSTLHSVSKMISSKLKFIFLYPHFKHRNDFSLLETEWLPPPSLPSLAMLPWCYKDLLSVPPFHIASNRAFKWAGMVSPSVLYVNSQHPILAFARVAGFVSVLLFSSILRTPWTWAHLITFHQRQECGLGLGPGHLHGPESDASLNSVFQVPLLPPLVLALEWSEHVSKVSTQLQNLLEVLFYL
jgi:hypothetical protein